MRCGREKVKEDNKLSKKIEEVPVANFKTWLDQALKIAEESGFSFSPDDLKNAMVELENQDGYRFMNWSTRRVSGWGW
jgi:hypothetical protein